MEWLDKLFFYSDNRATFAVAVGVERSTFRVRFGQTTRAYIPFCSAGSAERRSRVSAWHTCGPIASSSSTTARGSTSPPPSMRRARHAVPFWLRSSAGRLHAVAMLRVLLRLPALPPFPSLSSRLLPAMKRKLATPIAPESAAKRTRSATSKAAAGSLNNFVSSSTSGASPPTTKRKPATTPKSISKKIRSAAAKATTGNLNNFVKSSKATKSSLRSPASTPPPPPAIPPEEYDAPLLLPFYPSRVISNTRIRTYASGERPTPLVALQTKISATALERKRIEPAQFVVNWFRTDLRVPDNTSLHTAAQRGSVIGLYVWCPEDLDAHSVSPAKIDFMLRSLAVLREDLEKLDIPLWVETVERREDVPTRVVQLTEAWGARHVFANMEYEVDELRRDTECVQLGIDSGVAVEMLHDTCVVPPGILVTKVCVTTSQVHHRN